MKKFEMGLLLLFISLPVACFAQQSCSAPADLKSISADLVMSNLIFIARVNSVELATLVNESKEKSRARINVEVLESLYGDASGIGEIYGWNTFYVSGGEFVYDEMDGSPWILPGEVVLVRVKKIDGWTDKNLGVDAFVLQGHWYLNCSTLSPMCHLFSCESLLPERWTAEARSASGPSDLFSIVYNHYMDTGYTVGDIVALIPSKFGQNNGGE